MPILDAIKFTRPNQPEETLAGPFSRVRAVWHDQSVAPDWVSDAPPVVVTPPLTPTPPPGGAYWRPEWLDPIAPPVIARSRKADPGTLKSVLAARTRGDEILLKCGETYELDTLLGDACRLDKNDMRLGSYGGGSPPLLRYGGNFQVLSASAARLEIDGIDLESKRPVRNGTSGAYITGKDVRFANVRIHAAGEHCFNIRPSGKRVELFKVSNIGKVAGYFCYSNGSDLSIIEAVIDKPALAAYRGNECGDQYIAGCTIIGRTNDKLSAVVTFAYLSRVAFVGNTVVDAKVVTGPNPDINGFNQAATGTDAEKHAALISKSCDEVDIRDNIFTGGEIAIGVMSTDIRLQNNKGNPLTVVSPDTVLKVNGKNWTLPGAARVLVDGRREGKW